MPLAATLSTSEIYQAFLAPRSEGKTFFHGHTYTGNPLACAAALANLKVFREEQTMVDLQPKIEQLTQGLARLAENPHVGDVRQRGFMVGIELLADRTSKKSFPPDEFIGHKVCMEARNHGLIIRNLGDVLVLMPPLSITESEIELLVDATEAAIQGVLG